MISAPSDGVDLKAWDDREKHVKWYLYLSALASFAAAHAKQDDQIMSNIYIMSPNAGTKHVL
jgi:hypothetical protein